MGSCCASERPLPTQHDEPSRARLPDASNSEKCSILKRELYKRESTARSSSLLAKEQKPKNRPTLMACAASKIQSWWRRVHGRIQGGDREQKFNPGAGKEEPQALDAKNTSTARKRPSTPRQVQFPSASTAEAPNAPPLPLPQPKPAQPQLRSCLRKEPPSLQEKVDAAVTIQKSWRSYSMARLEKDKDEKVVRFQGECADPRPHRLQRIGSSPKPEVKAPGVEAWEECSPGKSGSSAWARETKAPNLELRLQCPGPAPWSPRCPPPRNSSPTRRSSNRGLSPRRPRQRSPMPSGHSLVPKPQAPRQQLSRLPPPPRQTRRSLLATDESSIAPRLSCHSSDASLIVVVPQKSSKLPMNGTSAGQNKARATKRSGDPPNRRSNNKLVQLLDTE